MTIRVESERLNQAKVSDLLVATLFLLMLRLSCFEEEGELGVMF